jgi:hypothetical protein
MAKEVFDLQTKTFRPYVDGDTHYDVLPDTAELSFESAEELAEWVREAGILGQVIINPPSLAVIEPGQFYNGRQWEIPAFPPSGPSHIYTDGHTDPPNLRELIQARLDQGWNITDELKERLFSART